jgi:hypothetical protein
MNNIEQQLKKCILKNVNFVIDNKSIRSGKIKVFNIKQFFIRFKILIDDIEKEYELPYPYKLIETDNGFIFDYCLSAFCPPSNENYYKMLLCDKSNASKIYNNYLFMKF